MATSLDFTLVNEESYDKLTLGCVRSFKIPGVARDYHIVPIQAGNTDKIVITTDKFFSTGFVTAGQYPRFNEVSMAKDKYAMAFGQAQTSQFLEPLTKNVLTRLYPALLDRLRAFKVEEEKANRLLPPYYLRLLEDGVDGREKHCKALFSPRDVEFVKVAPEAMIFSDGKNGFLQKAPIRSFIELPKQGHYKARVVVRFLLLTPPPPTDEARPMVSVSLIVDQLLFSPDGPRAPQEMVLDSTDFFNAVVAFPDLSGVYFDTAPPASQAPPPPPPPPAAAPAPPPQPMETAPASAGVKRHPKAKNGLRKAAAAAAAAGPSPKFSMDDIPATQEPFIDLDAEEERALFPML